MRRQLDDLVVMSRPLPESLIIPLENPHLYDRSGWDTATIRTRLVNVAARLAHRARTIHLHLPQHWPWQHAWDNLFTAAYAPSG